MKEHKTSQQLQHCSDTADGEVIISILAYTTSASKKLEPQFSQSPSVGNKLGVHTGQSTITKADKN